MEIQHKAGLFHRRICHREIMLLPVGFCCEVLPLPQIIRIEKACTIQICPLSACRL